MTKTFNLTGEQGYQLMTAALEVVGSVSPGVLARCRRERAMSKRPLVSAPDLAQLADVLDEILPGAVDRVHSQAAGGSG